MRATRWPTQDNIPSEMATIDGVRMRIHKDRDRNLRLTLERITEKHPSKPAFIYKGETVTYADLLKKVRSIGAYFAANGIKKGDRIALLMSNTLEFVLGYLAGLYTGVVVVPLNVKLSPQELQYQLSYAGVKLLLLEKAFWENIKPIRPDLPELKQIHCIDEGSVDDLPDFSLLLQADPADCPEVEIDEEDIASINFTSGTTGKPKGVQLCHRNLTTNSINVCHILKTDGNMRQLVVAPLFHVAALHGQLVPGLILGATTVLMGPFSTKESLKLLAEYKITCVVAVPTIYWFWLTHEDFSRYDLTSIKTASCGGAPASPELIETMREKLPRAEFINAGGMTECSSLAWALPAEYVMEKLGSVGFAMPYVDVKIIDENGAEVKKDQAGELCYRGPNIAKGYWKNQAAWAETMKDGWLHSGDIGKVDQDGFLWLLDRAKDMIIRGGENIYCIEVENIIHHHPKVRDISIIGVPDKVLGEKVMAFVSVEPSESITVEEIREFCQGKIAGFKIPELLEVLDEIPRNASGKVQKEKLRQLADSLSQTGSK